MDIVNFKHFYLAAGLLDTGQSQNLLAVEGSVGGNPVDLKNGVMSYCSNQTTIMCMIRCALTFSTIHSPHYNINGGSYSAGENGTDLQGIGVYATNNHPNYAIRFPCRAITDYRCVLNDTVCTQEIRMKPGNALSASWQVRVNGLGNTVYFGSLGQLPLLNIVYNQ